MSRMLSVTNKPFMLSVIRQNVIMLCDCHYSDYCYADCSYGDCHYADCHYADCQYSDCHYADCHYSECRGTILAIQFFFKM